MQKPKDTLIKMHVPTLCDWFSSSLLLATPIACEQALLFGQAKRASRERASEGASARRGFAARSRVLARLTSLAQIGELARRPRLRRLSFRLIVNGGVVSGIRTLFSSLDRKVLCF